MIDIDFLPIIDRLSVNNPYNPIANHTLCK